MRIATYIAALGMLTAVAGCSQMGLGGGSNGYSYNGYGYNEQSAQMPQTSFDNGLRTSYAQPTTCSPADQTCGIGIGNPAVNSPIQKRLYPAQAGQ